MTTTSDTSFDLPGRHSASTGRPTLKLMAYPLSMVALFLLFVLIKSHALLVDPRFWAEEATDYFPRIQSEPGVAGLLLMFRGNFQFLENFLVWIATLVPLSRAPFVTTYGALFFHSLVAFQIALFVSAYRLNLTIGVLLVAAWAFLPATYEVWLNATNVQWVMGCSILMLYVMPGDWLQRHRWFAVALALVAGLSGIPSIIFSLLFLLRFLRERHTVVFWIGAVLSACVVPQIISIVSTPALGREFPRDPSLYVIPTVLQTLIAPVFGVDLATGIAHTRWAIVLGVLVAAVPVSSALFSPYRSQLINISAAWVFVSAVQIFGSIAPQIAFHGIANGRYFLSGSMCLCLLLALGTKSSRMGLLAVAMLGAVTFGGVSQRFAASWPNLFLTGPSWKSSTEHCRDTLPCQGVVWPDLQVTMQPVKSR